MAESKVNQGPWVTCLLCLWPPQALSFLYAETPLSIIPFPNKPYTHPQFSSYGPHARASSCLLPAACSWPTPPSVPLPRLASLVFHLASFVSGLCRNWPRLLLHPHHLTVRTSLATLLHKFPHILLFLSHILCSFPFVFIYFYLCAVWFLSRPEIHKDRKHVCFSLYLAPKPVPQT